ncbi:hypothetical protein E5348_04545 [Enterococcus hirae]|uniref:hypothetical protein n=1 Tax=Enterococcus hirae TaxID=1354 RepID=UPI0010947C7F|nr:hypothetical protein [Enterococcus hirae]TGY25680.1 hypothetical protein E5348_04545 [Enterococcus hirae]
MSKGCIYCNHKEPLNDLSNSNFVIRIHQNEDGYLIEAEYDDSYMSELVGFYIKYCPKCGRKLEVEKE